MDIDWQHYHRFNVSLLSAIGLWPYGNKLVLRLKRLGGAFFTLLCCFGQLATFFTVDYNKKLLLQNVPCIFVGCGCVLKYFSFLSASDYINRVTEAINGDWKYLSSKQEIRIIGQYIKRGKFHTKIFAMFICPTGICLLLLPLSSIFLDILMPLNEARNRSFPIMFELFFDQKTHFFLHALVYDATVIVTVLVFVSTETLLFVYVQHTCSLLAVTSHRIKERLCSAEARNPKRGNNVVMIRSVVEIHTRANRIWKIIRERFLPSYLILLIFGVLSLGAYVFRCSQTLSTHEFTDFFTSATFCLTILSYMFYSIYILQDVQYSSLSVFHAFCKSDWYEYSVPTRKLVLFCMLNTVKPLPSDIFGIAVPSFELFSLVFRITMSYVTALYSF